MFSATFNVAEALSMSLYEGLGLGYEEKNESAEGKIKKKESCASNNLFISYFSQVVFRIEVASFSNPTEKSNPAASEGKKTKQCNVVFCSQLNVCVERKNQIGPTDGWWTFAVELNRTAEPYKIRTEFFTVFGHWRCKSVLPSHSSTQFLRWVHLLLFALQDDESSSRLFGEIFVKSEYNPQYPSDYYKEAERLKQKSNSRMCESLGNRLVQL